MNSKLILVILGASFALAVASEQPVVLRRIIKSTPTATNLARIAIRSVSGSGEQGAVTELSSREAARFGKRNANETQQQQQQQPLTRLIAPAGQLKSTKVPSPAQIPTTSTSTAAPTTTASAAPTTTTATSHEVNQPGKHKASERVRAEPEVEILANSSSWQMMTAVEAPAAMLIASGVRKASASSDLQSASSSSEFAIEESGNDVLRASATKGGSARFSQSDSGESFSRLRQQSTVVKQQQQQQQQQSFFYPQQARTSSKTGAVKSATKWYQAPVTTPRPAPIIQQQSENYIEQTAEYGAAPVGQAEPFAFDFKTQDQSGNGQYRKEESDKNGVVHGSYGYTDANGIYRHVEYVADQNGFRANIKSNEPGLHAEAQPASIQLAKADTPANYRASGESNDWSSSSSGEHESGSSANLALTAPEFESSHKPESNLRTRRHYRN